MAIKSKGDTHDQKPSGLSVPPNEANQENDVKKWLGIIGRTNAWKTQISEKAGWPRFIREYKGDWDILQQSVDLPLIPINLIFAYVKTEIARLYFRDPYISVNPKRIEDLGASRIAEQLINYMWGEIDLKRQIKLAVMDALIIGHGWIKMGYTAEFGTVESKEKRGPGRPKNADPNLDTNEFVKSENVFAYHIPYTDVIFDPSATWPPTHNARWMAFKTIKPLSVVQDCGLYLDSVVADLKPSEVPNEDKALYAQEGAWVVLWEIWDREHKVIKTVSEGCDKYLKKPQPWPYKFDGFPATMISFNPIPNEPYPLSDIAGWEGQVIELTKMHSIMINHLKRWNRQVLIKAGMMTEEEKGKFKNSVDGGIIEYQGNKEDLFVPPYAAVQQDIYGVWNLTMDIIRNVSGQSETDRGANAKAQTRTLGELRLQLQGSKGRADEKVDQIEDAISEIARKLLTIMQEKFDLPKIIKIVGPKNIEKAVVTGRPSANQPGVPSYTGQNTEGEVESFSITKDDIHGEMDVDCVAGSTIPLNKENQLEILEKLVPNLELVGIKPGSKAAFAYLREYLRLINIQSLDQIVDLAEEEAQNAQPQDPEMVKVQAEIERDKIKTEGEMQKNKQKGEIEVMTLIQRMKADAQKTMLDLKATEAKTQAEITKAQVDVKKAEMQLQNEIIRSMLPKPAPTQNGSANGNKPEKPQ